MKQLSATKEIEMTMTWFEHHKEQALIQGRAEGRAETLCKLLVLKFGTIDSELEARIAASTPDALDRYLERILTATSLAAVFTE